MSGNEKWYRKLSDKLREKYGWLDADLNSEQVIKERKSTKAKEFAGYLYIELGKLLDEEVYVKKNGGIVFPPKIVVFLNSKDDNEWRGEKRQALTEDLQSICAVKLEEIANESAMSIKSIDLELKVDGSLEEGKIRVEHIWEDDRSETPPISEVIEFQQGKANEKESKKDALSIEANEMTIPYSEISNQVFYVEIWRNDNKEKELTFYQNQVTIGRNSVKEGKVDINLDETDTRIARKHATLEKDGNEDFWITANSDNPTKVGNFTVPKNRTVQVGNNQSIKIIEFTLKLRK